MKARDAKRGASLADALDGIKDCRRGLKEKAKYGEMCVELGAFENQGDAGGVGHGSTFIDVKTGKLVIDAAENIIRAEMKKLGVTP